MHAGTDAPGPKQPVPGARAALTILFVINLFNYIDRQVLSAVLPRLAMDGTIISPTDPDPNTKLGLLTSAFMVTYIVFSLLFGWLDGRGARRWVILGVGVIAWSLASGASGLAVGYAMLFATRCLVGLGEAAYAPVASAMLSDAYPLNQRGKVLAIFNLAVPVGSALGFGIGGLIAGLTGDWRPAFWFTFSGLLLGLWCFAKKELPRPPVTLPTDQPSPQTLERMSPIRRLLERVLAALRAYLRVVRQMMRIKSFALCCFGMTAITFVTGGVAAWVPVYFFQREARFEITPAVLAELEKKLPVEEVEKLRPLVGIGQLPYPEMKPKVAAALGESASTHSEKVFVASATPDSPNPGTLSIVFGGILVFGGIAATATGAWLGEKLRGGGVRGAYFWVCGGGAAFGFPCFLVMLYTPLPVAWAMAFLAIFGLFLYTGPGNVILANVVKSDVRGTAFAINILVIHALGDAISPTLIGVVADRSSLQFAFALTSVMIAVGAVLWLWGVKFLDADTAAAEES